MMAAALVICSPEHVCAIVSMVCAKLMGTPIWLYLQSRLATINIVCPLTLLTCA
jgi:hypothetical protein